jgi:methylmalonyl-CoA epimerase
MMKGLDHVGIAVENLDRAIETYTRILGVSVQHREKLSERNLEVAFMEAGNVMIELISPTSEESTVHRFLAGKGEGLHHIALKTDDVEAAVRSLASQSFGIAQKPQKGAHGRTVAFLHPKDCHGVLIELVQES